jgi:hypothetical protein
VTSIAIPDYYYWAKVLSLNATSSLYGVQFSTDGALLIAHCDSYPSFIVVFDVATGAVKSARSYSSGDTGNYNYLIKSMVISSGPSPMAYVLSNFKPGGGRYCAGQ